MVTAAVESRLARKANVRFDWVPLFDTMCEVQKYTCKGCCVDPEFPDETLRGCTYSETGVVEAQVPVPVPIILIPPADPPTTGKGGLYSEDTLTIARIEGFIELCPYFCNSAEFVAQATADPPKAEFFKAYESQFRTMHLRAGLSKDKWLFNPPGAGSPASYAVIPRYPLDFHEWSDAQFLKKWERVKARPGRSFMAQANGDAPQGCCGDVSSPGAGAPANTLSNGSGTVNIPAIETDCVPCNGNPNTFRSFGQLFPDPACIRLNLRTRRRLTFRENEGLTLWLDWTSFTPVEYGGAPDWRPNVGFYARLFGRALVERA